MPAFPNDLIGKPVAFRVINGEIVEFDPNEENTQAGERAEKIHRQLVETPPVTKLIQ
jgi:hypothetical protein